MKLTRRTIVLALVALALLGLNLADRGTGHRLAERLPILHALNRDAVTRIELSTALSKIILDKEDQTGVWNLTAPIHAKADQAAIGSLLNVFRKDVPVDVRVDQGNEADYGLDPGHGVVAEFFTGGDEPVLSFTVGNDSPGGSSFIRISGSDAVYRAKVGGRHRYDKTPTEWRNRVVLDFDGDEATDVVVTEGGPNGPVHLDLVRGPKTTDAKGKIKPGSWSIQPDPGWPVDQELVEEQVGVLGRMRASELLGRDYAGGFDPPRATVKVTLEDGTKRTLEIGTKQAPGAAFVRVGDRGEVYRIARVNIAKLLLPVDEFRNKTLLDFRRTDVDTLTYQEGYTSVTLQQDLATNLWRVIDPPNMDVDVKLVYFAVNTLATLRADDVSDVSPERAGLVDPAAKILVRFVDGKVTGLELGKKTRDARNRPAWFVRPIGSSEVYVLNDATVMRLKRGFGQG